MPHRSSQDDLFAGTPVKKRNVLDRLSSLIRYAGFARFFDIVNGFFNRCRGAWIQNLAERLKIGTIAAHTDVYLAEIIVRTDAAG